ncbi:MAG: hypothetical protein AB9872_07695 [Solidesulfovibrio sp.]
MQFFLIYRGCMALAAAVGQGRPWLGRVKKVSLLVAEEDAWRIFVPDRDDVSRDVRVRLAYDVPQLKGASPSF